MNKETFDKIECTLKQHIVDCMVLDGIKTTDDLKKWTIGSAQELQQFCKREEAFMTKFVQCDLYHLIGMGELTPPQMMKLTYLTKDWLRYRGTIKTLAAHFDKISQLPGLPVSAVYQTHSFSGITLTSGVTEFGATDLPYSIAGNLIQVLPDRLTEFINFWSSKTTSNFSENNFQQKLHAGEEYGGIRWTVDHLGIYVGVIKQYNVRMLFEGCAQKNN